MPARWHKAWKWLRAEESENQQDLTAERKIELGNNCNIVAHELQSKANTRENVRVEHGDNETDGQKKKWNASEMSAQGGTGPFPLLWPDFRVNGYTSFRNGTRMFNKSSSVLRRFFTCGRVQWNSVQPENHAW